MRVNCRDFLRCDEALPHHSHVKQTHWSKQVDDKFEHKHEDQDQEDDEADGYSDDFAFVIAPDNV
jgi:hypothetical protein